MKIKISISIVVIATLISCTKNEDNPMVQQKEGIEFYTNKTAYDPGEKVLVKFVNHTEDYIQIAYCRLFFLEKFYDSIWKSGGNPPCPLDFYYPTIEPFSIKTDTISFQNKGSYRLKTWIPGDTSIMELYTNEFEIEAGGQNYLSGLIDISTDKPEYSITQKIAVKIINNSDLTYRHFMCDNVDIAPEQTAMLQEGQWLLEDKLVICNTMGPAGYFGQLEPEEVLSDTLMLVEAGKYKLLYKFIHETDTLMITSNEFNIEQD